VRALPIEMKNQKPKNTLRRRPDSSDAGCHRNPDHPLYRRN